MNMMSPCTAALLLFTFAFLTESSSAHDVRDTPPGAYQSAQCQQATQCPLFDDVYAHTPAFRHALSLNLRHGGEVVPEWVKDKLPSRRREANASPPGPASTAPTMLPLRIDDRPYILGQMSDPQAQRHRLVALYDTERGFATIYYTNEGGKASLLGDTTEILRTVMNDYLNADSAFARSLASPDVVLPIPVVSQ
ncbi:hypothetical protein QTI33_08920 [Variovorax sp. J22P271]|uniref:hypothetical protein n=1 Tax=Variovorax davisae TaxID=3053515 RepID=UPI002574EF85|nr:hypothetical protein [Variovorax sp. J22P271]MDM0032251.1 hypothetical protein [Variovorax sp. J22P271]